jgi:hypothetical protein
MVLIDGMTAAIFDSYAPEVDVSAEAISSETSHPDCGWK